MRETRHIIASDALDVGQYTTVITLLSDPLPLTASEWRLLGLAYLRSGRFPEAELPLLRASTLGDPEGQVEYGNLLRASGNFDEALKHFEGIYPGLTGELQLRCLRWWGTSEFQNGLSDVGLARCERAWYGYLALGDDVLTGRITQTLAQMHLTLGNRGRAKHLYQEALNILPKSSNNSRSASLQGLANICIQEGDYSKAAEVLSEIRETVEISQSSIERSRFLALEAEYYSEIGSIQEYSSTLEKLRTVIHDLQDYELRCWTAIRLADLYSLQGKHSKALEGM